MRPTKTQHIHVDHFSCVMWMAKDRNRKCIEDGVGSLIQGKNPQWLWQQPLLTDCNCQKKKKKQMRVLHQCLRFTNVEGITSWCFRHPEHASAKWRSGGAQFFFYSIFIYQPIGREWWVYSSQFVIWGW